MTALGLVSPSISAVDLVQIRNLGTSLVFEPKDPSSELALRVSGPCNYQFRQSISEAGELAFRLDDTTIDGRYSFEVKTIPHLEADTLEVLGLASASGDDSQLDELCRAGALPPPPSVQSGGFLVAGSRIVYDRDVVEGDVEGDVVGGDPVDAHGRRAPPNKDIQYIDDLIINGSTCIGFDCVNGELFGFDTVRLKEVNLRIHFDDTSIAADFPSNDWELRANDSANGGANELAIEDRTHNTTPFTVRAAAPSNALFVAADGRLGARTSTPAKAIHVVAGAAPALRLEQDSSLGFAPQVWDVTGNASSFFVHDVTTGSRPLTIRPGAPSHAISVATDGDVGLGTTTPDASLHVRRDVDGPSALRIENPHVPSRQARLELANERQEWLIIDNHEGELVIGIPSDPVVRLDPATLQATFSGAIVTAGGGLCDPGPCDRTFVDYELESIEEHAEYMWREGHLWGVGPTPEDQPVDLGKKVTGILHELEKAHIYIEHLHSALETVEAQNRALAERLDTLETRHAR